MQAASACRTLHLHLISENTLHLPDTKEFGEVCGMLHKMLHYEIWEYCKSTTKVQA